MHYAVIDSTSGKAVGTVALMRIDACNGVIEIGSVTYSRHMQRTRISTEVMALFCATCLRTSATVVLSGNVTR